VRERRNEDTPVRRAAGDAAANRGDESGVAEPPLDAMIATFREKYARLMGAGGVTFSHSDFESEVSAEVAER
jgi:hypothetical protein